MLRERRFPDWLLGLDASHDGDLAKPLAELITMKGLTGAADALGVHKATLSYWVGVLGLATAFVVLAPGDILDIKRHDGTVRRVAHKGTGPVGGIT